MRSWGMTDTGLVRRENQDSYDVRTLLGYTSAVVCDGMGGPAGGRLASSLAVETFQRELEPVLKEEMSLQQLAQILVPGQFQTTHLKRVFQLLQHDIRNAKEVLLRQMVEGNDLIHTVEEFRA